MTPGTLRNAIAPPLTLVESQPPMTGAKPTPADRQVQAAARPFAEMLRQTRAQSQPQPAPAPAAVASETAMPPESSQTAGTDEAAAPTAAAARPKARSGVPTPNGRRDVGDKTIGPSTGDAAEAHDESENEVHAGRGRSTDTDSRLPTAADAAAQALRARGAGNDISAHHVATVDEAASDAALASNETTTGPDRPARGRATTQAQRASREDAAVVGRLAAGVGRDGLTVGRDASFAAVLAQGGKAVGHVDEPRPGDTSAAALVGLAAATAPATNGSAASEAPATTLNLPTPVASPEFAAALGARVSVLVKDGIEQAELHLNPAEMGPVSIHIRVEGSEARIEFGAGLAATRQAIENGLPELAAALRDAGFTLAGGGVSQHAGQQAGGRDGGDGGDEGRSHAVRIDGAAGDASSGPAARRVAVGGVDLYA